METINILWWLQRPRHGKRQYTQQNERENGSSLLETAVEQDEKQFHSFAVWFRLWQMDLVYKIKLVLRPNSTGECLTKIQMNTECSEHV